MAPQPKNPGYGSGSNGPVICPKLYIHYDSKSQQNYYAIHLYIRGQNIISPEWCFGDYKPVYFEFNDTVMKNLNTTFGEIARLVLDFEDSFK